MFEKLIQGPSFIVSLLFFSVLVGCTKQQGFQSLSPNQTNIHFNNQIPDNPNINILNSEYIYNGGGVGIADFNADGQLDLFFSGNLVNNALYLHQGGFEFEEVTTLAGVAGKNKWSNGVSIVDINNDHLPDIYVCVSSLNSLSTPKNQLFVNQGNNEKGIPTFKELAEDFGIASTKHSRHAAFFDYDRDGDLDLFILNNIIGRQEPTVYRKKKTNGTAPSNDQLYRNNGDLTFTEITKEAGILLEGYSLGIAVGDVNMDGFPDVYIANDYITNDILYINQKDGTFKNEIGERTTIQSKFSMGAALVDFDNDAAPDIFVVDMMSATNDRLKRHVKESNYNNRKNNQHYKYQEQIARNVLQHNDGTGNFGEIGMYAGVYASDWSWSPLTADFNNDGLQDIYVTNGFPKDITELDWMDYRAGSNMALNRKKIFEKLVIEKVPNCLFLNKGNMQFEEQAKNWQIDIPSFSNGATYADFDQNGFLDIVVNNINEKAFVLENQAIDNRNYLQIQFPLTSRYSSAIGAKIWVMAAGQTYYQEYYLNKSYQSSVAPFLHFGLGETQQIDSVIIEYPSWERAIFTKVPLNQVFEIPAKKTRKTPTSLARQKIKNQANKSTTRFAEAIFPLKMKTQRQNDFFYQRTLPFAYSSLGPLLATTDLDKDNTMELLVIDPYDELLYWVNTSNQSIDTIRNVVKKGANGLLVADMDLDGQQDLVITYGGYTVNKTTQTTSVEILLNKGNRNFEKQTLSTAHSFGVVRGNDLDADGDIDLFLGGTIYQNHFPIAGESFIWKNPTIEDNRFSLNEEHLISLGDLGIVMDALWTDMNNDDRRELLVTAHLKPIQMLSFQEGKWDATETSAIQGNATGFWNSILPIDYENDGDIDYVLSNLGINTPLTNGEHPVQIAYSDVDDNGSVDGFIGFQFNNEPSIVPFEFRNEVIAQVPPLKKQFVTYKSFAEVTFNNFISEQNQASINSIAIEETRHQLLLNKGNEFELIPLSQATQMSPMYGMTDAILNDDTWIDVIGATNLKDTREFWGTYSALNGAFLSSTKDGPYFDTLWDTPKIKGDSRSIVTTLENGQLTYWISRVEQPFLTLSTNCDNCFFYQAKQDDQYALINYKDGTKQKREFYLGKGFRSHPQSNFWLSNMTEVASIEIKGKEGIAKLEVNNVE